MATFVLEGFSTGANVTTLSLIGELRHTEERTDLRVIVVESVLPHPKVRAFLQAPEMRSPFVPSACG